MNSKNYISPCGFKKLKQELEHLLKVERPQVTETVAWAASNGDRSENADYQYGKKRLREIDKRIEFLTKRIDDSDVVDPEEVQSEQVKFGATVKILDEEGQEKVYSILGVDEVDAHSGRISWKSPLGAALLNKQVGDYVEFRSPKGLKSIEIIGLEYKQVDY